MSLVHDVLTHFLLVSNAYPTRPMQAAGSQQPGRLLPNNFVMNPAHFPTPIGNDFSAVSSSNLSAQGLSAQGQSIGDVVAVDWLFYWNQRVAPIYAKNGVRCKEKLLWVRPKTRQKKGVSRVQHYLIRISSYSSNINTLKHILCSQTLSF